MEVAEIADMVMLVISLALTPVTEYVPTVVLKVKPEGTVKIIVLLDWFFPNSPTVPSRIEKLPDINPVGKALAQSDWSNRVIT
jgi:hypothetical protein